MLIADLHVHTWYSRDSILKPSTLLKIAKKRGLNVIAITDHNTIKGASAVLEEISKNYLNNLSVIPGVEMSISGYDILCLFITTQPKRIEDYIEFLEYVKCLGAVTILAHPYRKRKSIPKKLAEKVDLIEALNARTSSKANTKARQLATILNKNVTAGSDAHVGFEIGRARTIFLDQASDLEELRKVIVQSKRILVGKEIAKAIHLISTIIEMSKKLRLVDCFLSKC